MHSSASTQRQFERERIHIADSTLGGWVESLHTLCDPFVLAMCAEAKATCPFIATDATGVLVMAKEECRRGHFFELLGGDKHVLFRYSKEHTSAAIQGFLAGYQGYVVTDAHSIYGTRSTEAESASKRAAWRMHDDTFTRRSHPIPSAHASRSR